ncbi:MAG: hypothetical protein R2704_15325 [Microthrixaceae bacterium]|nr:hypothetical protein [Microthrixaceae bacterium]
MNLATTARRWAATRAGGLVAVAGTISSASFGDGHRFVVGHWPTSPIGPLADVMWTDPDDRRTLLVGDAAGAEFIGSIYEFDQVAVGPISVTSDGRRTSVSCSRLQLELAGGRLRPVPFPRPLAITRWVEAPIARWLMGVETYGTSPTGAREWYQTRGWRWVTDGHARLDGADLGAPQRFEAPVGVGFSEPPARPSIVKVRVTIDLPRSHR